MNYEKELTQLKEDLEKAKSLKYRAEARLEQLKQQENEIIKELDELGVKPEDLENEISKLTSEINNLFKESNELLPKDLIEKKGSIWGGSSYKFGIYEYQKRPKLSSPLVKSDEKYAWYTKYHKVTALEAYDVVREAIIKIALYAIYF